MVWAPVLSFIQSSGGLHHSSLQQIDLSKRRSNACIMHTQLQIQIKNVRFDEFLKLYFCKQYECFHCNSTMLKSIHKVKPKVKPFYTYFWKLMMLALFTCAMLINLMNMLNTMPSALSFSVEKKQQIVLESLL